MWVKCEERQSFTLLLPYVVFVRVATNNEQFHEEAKEGLSEV